MRLLQDNFLENLLLSEKKKKGHETVFPLNCVGEIMHRLVFTCHSLIFII